MMYQPLKIQSFFKHYMYLETILQGEKKKHLGVNIFYEKYDQQFLS